MHFAHTAPRKKIYAFNSLKKNDFWPFYGLLYEFLGVLRVFSVRERATGHTFWTRNILLLKILSLEMNHEISNEIFIFYHIGGLAYENLRQETFAPWAVLRNSVLCLSLFFLISLSFFKFPRHFEILGPLGYIWGIQNGFEFDGTLKKWRDL